MDELLQVSVISLPGLIWIQLYGELNAASAECYEIQAAAAVPREAFLVLDARGLASCDVAGLRALSVTLEDWAGRGYAASCLLSGELERMARFTGAPELLARVEDANLLAHVASATVSDLEPPLAEWA